MRIKIVTSFVAIVAVSIAVLIGCASDSTSPDTQETTGTSGIYMFEESEVFRYLYVPSGNAVLRGRAGKTDDLKALARERDCFFEPKLVNWKLGRERWLKLHEEDVYLHVATIGAEGQYFLSFDETDLPDDQDSSFVFYIHEFGDVNGRREVCVESMQFPGYYLKNDGNTLSGNAVTLKPFESKERAPRMLVHKLSPVDVGINVD